MEEMVEVTAQDRLNACEGEINGLLTELANTDWCVVKCMEIGANMSELYPKVYKARTDARERINELQMLLPALREAVEQEEQRLAAQPLEYPEEEPKEKLEV